MGIVRFDMAYASTTHTTFDTNGLSLGHLLTDGPLSVVPGKELFIFFYFFFIFFLFFFCFLSQISLTFVDLVIFFNFHCCTTFSGWNLLRASGRFVAQGPDADKLIQKFLAGESNVLRAVAPSVHASSDPLFSQFVGGLSLDTTLHGEKTGLIKQGVMLL
jgi:hypothetical protein